MPWGAAKPSNRSEGVKRKVQSRPLQSYADGEVHGKRLARSGIRKAQAQLNVRRHSTKALIALLPAVRKKVQLIQSCEVVQVATHLIYKAPRPRHRRILRVEIIDFIRRSGKLEIIRTQLYRHTRIERKACQQAARELALSIKLTIDVVQAKADTNPTTQFQAIEAIVFLRRQSEREERTAQQEERVS